MFPHLQLNEAEDLFTRLEGRVPQGVYFYRIIGYSDEIEGLLTRYYEAAIKSGVVIEGNIPNPNPDNLAYYKEMMGDGFSLDKSFITKSLSKWLPRMDSYQNKTVTDAVYGALTDLRDRGKNDNILRNVYIKLMCWLYYKFERIVGRLGKNDIPKILYEGSVTYHELILLRILSMCGCDIVLLEYDGDAAYKKLDSVSEFSSTLGDSSIPFPPVFSVKTLREKIREQQRLASLFGAKPSLCVETNSWFSGKGLSDIQIPPTQRGNELNVFYNAFMCIRGVEDKLNYASELYKFNTELKTSGRNTVIVEGSIKKPDFDEVKGIQKGMYTTVYQMIAGLRRNLSFVSDRELLELVNSAFTEIAVDLSKRSEISISRLLNKLVFMICWLKRYCKELFGGYKKGKMGCFIFFGGCKSSLEADFLRLLARLPVDVLVLVPDIDDECVLEDKALYRINYKESIRLADFPKNTATLGVGTVAYHAERELDEIMYKDTGLYRSQQYGTANVLILKTMYEEISILWKEEMRFRPNFSTDNGVVTLPVIFAKVCGVKNSNVTDYWIDIKNLFTADTVFYSAFPIIPEEAVRQLSNGMPPFLYNGKLKREEIKRSRIYKYSMLREEAQEHILDKLQLLLDEKIIRGTFQDGTEYGIMAIALNLDKVMMRLIQKFDFTKTNPKVVCVLTGEQIMSKEDTVYLSFLSLLGFDIAVFVPTGYNVLEKHYNNGKALFLEHQIGDYLYDLTVPDFKKIGSKKSEKKSWIKKLF